MEELHIILKDCYRFCLLLSAGFGAFYFLKLKKSYWRWLSVYLIVIFLQESFWRLNFFSLEREYRVAYYVLLGIPLQYIFLYWLYAYKSLKNTKYFFISISFYFITLISALLYKNMDEVLSISTNIGTFLLIILLVLEFVNQIKSDRILKFKQNKMFYINIGLILFYIGNYPFHILGPELYNNYHHLWNFYYLYFLVTNCLMYLLFSASFIWGKTQ
jgi:hypothetical protein